jgi:hypothetical protein
MLVVDDAGYPPVAFSPGGIQLLQPPDPRNVRLESLHTLLALAAIRDLDIMQVDVTSAYLHRTLKEEIYMEQPDGYVAPGKEDWVWRLKKVTLVSR